MTIRELGPEEYAEYLAKKISEDGILKAVREQIDELMILCQTMTYKGYGYAIGHAQEIMDLLNMYIKLKSKNPDKDYELETLKIPD